MTWRRIAHSDDPVFRSWPRDWILPDSSIILTGLARNPRRLCNTQWYHKILAREQWLARFVGETKFHAIIRDYNILTNMNTTKKRRQRTAPANLPTEDEDDSLGPESEDEPDIYNQGESTKDDANDSNSDNDQDEWELYDNPQHEKPLCSWRIWDRHRKNFTPPASQTHSPVPSRPPSPDTMISSHQRAWTVTPAWISFLLKTPSCPTKRRKLDNTTKNLPAVQAAWANNDGTIIITL